MFELVIVRLAEALRYDRLRRLTSDQEAALADSMRRGQFFFPFRLLMFPLEPTTTP